MLKLIAAILVISGTSGLGFFFCKEMKERVCHLQYLVQLLTMLQSEITYGKATMAEACYAVGQRAKEPYRGFLLNIHKCVQAYSGEGLLPIWHRELTKISKEIPLKQEDLNLFDEVIEEQGYLDGEMQIRKMAFQIEQIQEKIEKLKKEEDNKSRIYLCIGVMSGILCTIIFL